MIPDYMPAPPEETLERVREQRDRYATAIANVVVYSTGRSDLTGEEIGRLLAGEIPERLRDVIWVSS